MGVQDIRRQFQRILRIRKDVQRKIERTEGEEKA